MFRIRSISDRIRIPVFNKTGSGSIKILWINLSEYAVVICRFIGKKACWIWFYPVKNIFESLRLALRGSYYEFIIQPCLFNFFRRINTDYPILPWFWTERVFSEKTDTARKTIHQSSNQGSTKYLLIIFNFNAYESVFWIRIRIFLGRWIRIHR